MVELNTWHRGRLIDHIQLVVADFDACRRFYSAVFDALGVPYTDMSDDGYLFADELFISKGEPTTGRAHLAFQAADHDAVKRFYEAALAAGGRECRGCSQTQVRARVRARIGASATIVKGTATGKSGSMDRISVRRTMVASARVASSMAK